jgi:hypothetical protein
MYGAAFRVLEMQLRRLAVMDTFTTNHYTESLHLFLASDDTSSLFFPVSTIVSFGMIRSISSVVGFSPRKVSIWSENWRASPAFAMSPRPRRALVFGVKDLYDLWHCKFRG